MPAGEIGRKNVKFGWWWLLLFFLCGLCMEALYVLWPAWETVEKEATRQTVIFSHVHGIGTAFLNIFYGYYIGSTSLSQSLKKLGSALAIFGAAFFPVVVVLSIFIPPILKVAPLGGLALIISVALMAWGQVSKT